MCQTLWDDIVEHVRSLEFWLPEYRVTVSGPADDEGGWDDRPCLTLVVDSDGEDLRVTEMVMRPGASGQLVLGDVPQIDLNLLARALLLTPPPTTCETTTAPAASSPQPTEEKPSEFSGDGSPPKGRPYRKMPEPSQVLKVLREEGTVTAMARRFGVPRHTAQGWLQRIRRD
jgi:hypothetical protein